MLFYVYNYIQLIIAKCESRNLALSSQCNVCFFWSHIVTLSFSLQQISLLFLLCCWLCPQVNPTIHTFPHFYSLVVTFYSLFVTFLGFLPLFPIFSFSFLSLLSFFRQACPILLLLLFVIIPSKIFLFQKLFPLHLCPCLATTYKSEL